MNNDGLLMLKSFHHELINTDVSGMRYERLVLLLDALILSLTHLSKIGEIVTDPRSVKHYASFSSVIDLSNRADLPDDAKSAFHRYFSSLPHFDIDKQKTQAEPVMEQHGFYYMLITKYFDENKDLVAAKNCQNKLTHHHSPDN